MNREEFNKEVNDLPEVKVGNATHRNNRLLSKEAAIYCFIENSKELNKGDECFLPENIEEVANELFSTDKVYLCRYPCDDHFNEEGEFIGEYPTHTKRSLDKNDILKDVKYYLGEGATVYVYVYYGRKQTVVVGDSFEKKNTYWWRIIAKK